METFTHYISLGNNCSIKRYLNSIQKTKETHFFDYIGTSLWSIIDLFNDDFKDFCSKELIKKIEIKESKFIYTNTKYYARLLHDFDQESELTDKYFVPFVGKYQRRKERLYNILKSNNKVLFIRVEENNNERIIHDIYKDKFTKTERDYLIDLSDLLHKKFINLEFVILHINLGNDIYKNKEKHIISVPQVETITWDNAVSAISMTIEKHNKFITDNIK